MLTPIWRRFPKYTRSKLANVCFTLELQRRLQGRGICAFSTSPGPVNSNLFRGFPWYAQWLLQPLARGLFRTPQQVRGLNAGHAGHRSRCGQEECGAR